MVEEFFVGPGRAKGGIDFHRGRIMVSHMKMLLRCSTEQTSAEQSQLRLRVIFEGRLGELGWVASWVE